MPVIDACAFGNIVIDGKRYTSDLIIYPDGHVEDAWRRKRGHRLVADDIHRLLATDPEILIVGMGAFGLMKPDKSLKGLLDQKGILMMAKANKRAIQDYNKLASRKQVGACFHLTC